MGKRARALVISVLGLFALGFVIPAYAGSETGSGPQATAAAESCNDGIDNDGDTLVDHDDPDCNEVGTHRCGDGKDNDGDGKIDAADPGCSGPNDDSEFDLCEDGKDNDGDGKIDAADPDCSPGGGGEQAFACGDGKDNDGDGAVDYPDDPGCRDAVDRSEKFSCEDGIDNDGDGTIDFGGKDKDEDGEIDVPADNGCESATDDTEGSDPNDTCDDGIDNDDDGEIDNCNEPGDLPPPEDPCSEPPDPGILGGGTIAQQLYDGGLSALPIVQDPDADGPISGSIYVGGTGTPIEPLTDEVGCVINLPITDL